MEITLIILLTLIGVLLLRGVFYLLRRSLDRAGDLAAAEPSPRLSKPTADSLLDADGLVYLFAHQFVKPVPKRALGTVVRDRVWALLDEELELCPDDLAEQLLYTMLTELYQRDCLELRTVRREASFMPPFPHKQWEMQFRQRCAFPTTPLAESLQVAFALARKNRLRSFREAAELLPEDEFFSLEELLERALKAIRQEMTYFERGTVCTDLRGHVEAALIAGGYLSPPERETWLDAVRQKRPTVNREMVLPLQPEAEALVQRREVFRQRYGSSATRQPVPDQQGKLTDLDPELMKGDRDPADLPLDDCLRATVHEAISAIKQLEPSGEAGI
jgi:hypothetical protein